METAAVAIPMVASVASAGASVAGALQSKSAGVSNRMISDAQAQRLEQNAQAERDMAEVDAGDIRIQTRRGLGSIRANAGASGTVIEDGSGLEALIESAGAGELNAQRRIWQGEVRARGLQNDANITRATGLMSQQRADSAATGGFLQAGASLLTGVSRAKNLFGGSNKGGEVPNIGGDPTWPEFAP